METTNKILYKTCKTCKESKDLSRYRPYAKECKNCTYSKDNKKNSPMRLKKFYANHKQEMKEESLLNYYKKIYNNNNLSMHEVNLFRIAL